MLFATATGPNDPTGQLMEAGRRPKSRSELSCEGQGRVSCKSVQHSTQSARDELNEGELKTVKDKTKKIKKGKQVETWPKSS